MALVNRTVAIVCLVCHSSCAGLCFQEAGKSYADFYDDICMLAVDLGTCNTQNPTNRMVATMARIANSFNYENNEERERDAKSYPHLAKLAQLALIQTPQSALLRAGIMVALADEEKRKALVSELLDIVKSGMVTKLYATMTDFSASVMELTMLDGSRSHKEKKRKTKASVFAALATTCVQLGNILGIVRPESRAMLSLFGVALNVVSRVIKSKQKQKNEQHNEPPVDEEELIVMTKEEFSAHVLSLLQSVHGATQSATAGHNQEVMQPHKGFDVQHAVDEGGMKSNATIGPDALFYISNQLYHNLCVMLENALEEIDSHLKEKRPWSRKEMKGHGT